MQQFSGIVFNGNRPCQVYNSSCYGRKCKNYYRNSKVNLTKK
ncbi:hypothetical protein HMPREF9999_00959 [Alloprevotella sp. oral taxon 473 str. F0040]|nr:hypothetical protein HMPREF9999_00959 [Alloprevotella sp. oral taxon 473 str. F0040]